MRIVWDEPKRQANIRKHGYDFADLSLEFFRAATIGPTRLGRRIAVGTSDGQVVVVVFAPLGTEAISVISMRRANPRERSLLDD